jgi:LacI family repressor for deo operon, udp, cdd, tsx, nupC, and nupG
MMTAVIPKQQVSMADVAAQCGVSIASVSRALRGEPGVSTETRERVRRVADQLAYVVSPEASALSGGATRRVGVVVPKIDTWFYSSVVAGMADALQAADLDLMLCCLQGSSQRRQFFDTLPLRRKVDAVIVVAAPLSAAERARFDELNVPLAFLGGRPQGGSPWVGIDDKLAAEQAVAHLLRIGHRNIAMIQAVDPEGVAWEGDKARVAGFHAQLDLAGIGDPKAVVVEWGIDGGARGMEMLLSEPSIPTGVFCHSDEVAVGAVLTLRRAGITVPQEISVIGVDNHPSAELVGLTTVGQPGHQQGTVAAEMVAEMLAGGTVAAPHRVLPTRLVVRGSTAPPKRVPELS